MEIDKIMPIQISLSDYIEVRSLLIQIHKYPSKTLSLFKYAILELNRPILFSMLLNNFIISHCQSYLHNMDIIFAAFKYAIEYNNIHAFRLLRSLQRQDLIYYSVCDARKRESISMLAALYGSIDILHVSLVYSYSMLEDIQRENIYGETLLHYAIKNSTNFNKEKIIDYLLKYNVNQDLLYDEKITLREKILEIKEIRRKKLNFLFCYKKHDFKDIDPKIGTLAVLSIEPIKQIFKFIG